VKLRTLGVSFFLFLLALVPRALGLNVFLTNDERRWVDRSIMFLRALLDGNLLGTASGHPGVTTMWTAAIALTTKYVNKARSQGMPVSAIGLREFLRRVPVRPVLGLDVLATVRLPTVVLVSLAVVGIYLLLRRLFDGKTALLGAALVALDPFYLAYSRLLHHDALATTFMILSLLSLMAYLESQRSGGYLLLSGLMAGLAFLSKASSLFLIPFMAWPILLSNWPRGQGAGGAAQRRDALLHGAKTYLAWCVLSLLTVIVCWPAMWVDPMRPIGLVLGQVTGKVQGTGGDEGGLLRGISLLDARLLTYPITLLFQITPLALVGAAAAVWFLGQDRCFPLRPKSGRLGKSIITLLFYILGFIVSMSLASVKSGRYILPVSPAVQIVAAVGLCRLGESVAKVVRAPRTRLTTSTLGTMGLGLTILLQAGLSLPHHPYYLTYYNPLLGGGVVAPRLVPIGWGEGLDQAAHYLNQKENATGLKAAMWDSDVRFASFFRGEIRKLNEECNGNSLPWEDIDYVVLYIDNRGTGAPFGLSTAKYFDSLEPEHVVHIKGIDYVWIYAAPGPEIPSTFVPAQYDRRVEFGSSSLLLGYALEERQLKAGQATKVTLYWQCQKPSEANRRPVLTLVDEEGEVWGRERGAEDWEDPWGRGLVVRDELELEVDPATPAGTYQLLLSLYDEEKGERLPTPEGEEVSLGLMMVAGKAPTPMKELEITHLQRADLGSEIRFLGYDLSGTRFQPGDTLRLVLYWEVLAEMDQDYTVFTHLIDRDGVVWGQKDSWPVDGLYPTSQWAQGDVIEDPYEIGISPETPSGDYRLEVGMYLLETGERFPVIDESGPPPGNRILLSSTVEVGRRE